MSSARAKLKRLDEEARYLGDPVIMPHLPKKEGAKEAPRLWNVFLRPPRGVTDRSDANLLGDLLGQYPGGAGDVQAMYLGVAGDRKEYASDVLQLFPKAGEVKKETVTIKGAEGDFPVTRYTYDDNRSTLSVNLSARGGTHVAVVYRVSPGGLVKAAQAIDMSLATLGVGPGADALRRQYREEHKKK
jgi:hypothetical protein